MSRLHLGSTALMAGLLLVAANAQAQVLFSDNMESGAGWSVNSTNADYAATFGFDYGDVPTFYDVPEAPNTQPGDAATTGVLLESNINDPPGANTFNLFPTGQSFSGNYKLRFDAWTNYDVNERINGGSAGTTEFIGGGVGYDGVAAAFDVGASVIATNDGGSGSDWRVFADGSFLATDEMIAGTRNGFDAHYADFLPGVAPPLGQFQSSADPGTAGSPGFQWITFEIETGPLGVVAVSIEKPGGDRLNIARVRDAYDAGDGDITTDGNIQLIYTDLFSSQTIAPYWTYGIIDNVEVTATPEPTSAALVALGLLGVAGRRRRR
ncbi:hypothetical protein Mal64_27610 [Pseudobythopirellula maris]|uniref:Ice-binding protein C-terminal domain-containing protein n=1 Tax=Pseudobythopirellula maris TaxID=2527991 RepID=A0A5C5ZLB1_9BACT|nr:PEP-CTERM sorting domain-containing protein [Pseudobythopirellula maris]TWT87223.1 hypothetical protein Mal64_27610 [Pseudobythopirellula maris]